MSRASRPFQTDRQREVNALFASATDFWSGLYNRDDGDSSRFRLRLQRALRWVDELGFPAGARALDAGAGAGLSTVALARRGFVVDAIDSVEAMVGLILAAANSNGLSERVQAQLGDVHALSAEAETYDVVVALGLVPWLHSPRQAVMEMARVLKPGGYVIVSCENRFALSVLFEPMYNPMLEPARRVVAGSLRRLGWRKTPGHAPRPRTQSRHSFDRLLREAGFNKRAGQTYGFGPFSFLNHRLPDRIGLSADRRLQALADSRFPIISSAGVGYMVLAQKPCPENPPGGPA